MSETIQFQTGHCCSPFSFEQASMLALNENAETNKHNGKIYRGFADKLEYKNEVPKFRISVCLLQGNAGRCIKASRSELHVQPCVREEQFP